MAKYYKLLFLWFIIYVLYSCQNEGYIGDLYGQWALRQSFIDGRQTTHDNLYFSFQGKVVWAKSTNATLHTYNDVFGSYSQLGDSLVMSFVQQSISTSPKSLIEGKFGFSDPDNVRVLVSKISQSELILSDGDCYWVFEKY